MGMPNPNAHDGRPPRPAPLTRADWSAAGLVALLEGGPRAVTVEGVASRLGATKGSGYWHFSSRADLLQEVVAEYRRTHTDALIEHVHRQADSPRDQLRLLFDLIFRARQNGNEARILLSDEPVIAEAVADLAERRIGFVAGLVSATGVGRSEARRRAELAYCVVLGHEVLLAAAPGSMSRPGRGATRTDRVLAVLLDDPAPDHAPGSST